MVIGTLTPSGTGLLQGGPQGAASFPNALIIYQPSEYNGITVVMPLNPANGQFDLVEQSATADLYGDLLGYFRAPQGGYVSSISAGNGISITGSATAPTIGISPTHSNLNIYRWSGGVGTINQGAALAFYGPTASVPVAANQSITGTVSAALSTTSGTANTYIALCYRLGAGAVTPLSGAGSFHIVEVSTTRVPYTQVGSSSALAAGTYTVGFCAQNTTATSINSNDYSVGWVTVHN
jgi:hypothetical protein